MIEIKIYKRTLAVILLVGILILAVLVYIFQPLVLGVVIPPPTAEEISTGSADTKVVTYDWTWEFEEIRTVELINGKRLLLKLPPVSIKKELTTAARFHSTDIGVKNICSHEGTDKSNPLQRIISAGYKANGYGEIVACRLRNVDDAVNHWWDSQGHHDIIVGNFVDIGCGWWKPKDSDYGFATCEFGIISSTKG